jgi:hypothetical protein
MTLTTLQVDVSLRNALKKVIEFAKKELDVSANKRKMTNNANTNKVLVEMLERVSADLIVFPLLNSIGSILHFKFDKLCHI